MPGAGSPSGHRGRRHPWRLRRSARATPVACRRNSRAPGKGRSEAVSRKQEAGSSKQEAVSSKYELASRPISRAPSAPPRPQRACRGTCLAAWAAWAVHRRRTCAGRWARE
eukprot:scaffold12776_cov63-Phaeocystis_antarctica.AAC.1